MPKITLNAPYSITHGNVAQSLTDAEGRLMWAFMLNKGLTTDEMAKVIWGHGAHWPLTYSKCTHVYLWKLRKKLEPFGWSISRGKRGANHGEDAKRYLEKDGKWENVAILKETQGTGIPHHTRR